MRSFCGGNTDQVVKWQCESTSSIPDSRPFIDYRPESAALISVIAALTKAVACVLLVPI
jgi:hypothetical protein